MNFDPVPYALGLRKLNELERQEIKKRTALAKTEANRLAAAIKAADQKIRAVYLFGSLAEGEPKHLDFDIDLALDGGDVYLAMDATTESTFDVDVVDLARLPIQIRETILRKGVRL
jgi:predicted nucleotidyltransferase